MSSKGKNPDSVPTQSQDKKNPGRQTKNSQSRSEEAEISLENIGRLFKTELSKSNESISTKVAESLEAATQSIRTEMLEAIQSIKTSINNIAVKFNELDERVAKLENAPDCINKSQLAAESADRVLRSNNFIIFNVAEGDRQSDLVLAEKLYSDLEIKTDLVGLRRLGRLSEPPNEKRRPIVTSVNSQIANQVIQKFNGVDFNGKRDQEWKGILVDHDLTRSQQERKKHLYELLKKDRAGNIKSKIRMINCELQLVKPSAKPKE